MPTDKKNVTITYTANFKPLMKELAKLEACVNRLKKLGLTITLKPLVQPVRQKPRSSRKG